MSYDWTYINNWLASRDLNKSFVLSEMLSEIADEHLGWFCYGGWIS